MKSTYYKWCYMSEELIRRHFDEITLAPGLCEVYKLSERTITECVDNYVKCFPEGDLKYNLEKLVFIQLINTDHYVIVSKTDYERIKLGFWHDSNGYGRDTTELEPFLHRQITYAPKDFEVHHKGDKFNNLRSCLELLDENEHRAIRENRGGSLQVQSEADLIRLLKRLLDQEATL